MSVATLPSHPWREQLLGALSTREDLAAYGLPLPKSWEARARITPHYAALMKRDEAGRVLTTCPIYRQAVPHSGEADPALPEAIRAESMRLYGRSEPWGADPIGDRDLLVTPRLTHRYQDRALLHLSSSCAVYCRFCFRKEHLNDPERSLYTGELEPALRYLRAHPEVRELILTGGDPLSVATPALERLFASLDQIASIQIVRIHSRMLVTLPQRFEADLVALLGRPRGFRVKLVSHFNCAEELSETSRQAALRLARAGVDLYNQSVLLRGINDSTAALTQLLNGLDAWGVRPIYLHHPDWTRGTFGFRTSIRRGLALYRTLRGQVAGPALPQYVLDLPGGGGKVPLSDPAFVEHVRSIDVPHTSTPPLECALYRIQNPHTRLGYAGPNEYLDLAFAQ